MKNRSAPYPSLAPALIPLPKPNPFMESYNRKVIFYVIRPSSRSAHPPSLPQTPSLQQRSAPMATLATLGHTGKTEANLLRGSRGFNFPLLVVRPLKTPIFLSLLKVDSPPFCLLLYVQGIPKKTSSSANGYGKLLHEQIWAQGRINISEI